ncbi:hypothetical protein CAC42_7224 [Sphaceloma murrayae]|uniref:AAA+ ATPase domain-containing protein n=1 Tax=Sphaceloma murrayae TaxID=2082308 RepID=A0A2K1QQH2_9PEZI|nr:hypothetical protein CAC42_7224 [Sphaceloma murrayae]
MRTSCLPRPLRRRGSVSDDSSSSSSELTTSSTSVWNLKRRSDHKVNRESEHSVPSAKIGMRAECLEFYRSSHKKTWKAKKGPPSATAIGFREQYAVAAWREKDTQRDDGVNLVMVEIHSPLIKEVLARVFVGYRNLAINVRLLEFYGIPAPFVHRWEKFLAAVDQAKGETRRHLNLLKEVLEPQIRDVVLEARDLVPRGLISFQLLWTLFEPGKLVYYETSKQDRAYLVDSVVCNRDDVVLWIWWIDYDGEKLGLSRGGLTIDKFEGFKDIQDLKIMPLELKKNSEQVKTSLIDRGRRWRSLLGSYHKTYDGTYLQASGGGSVKHWVEDVPIMIDGKMYAKYAGQNELDLEDLELLDNDRIGRLSTARKDHELPTESTSLDGPQSTSISVPAKDGASQKTSSSAVTKRSDSAKGEDTALADLTDDQYLLCTPWLRGYCFSRKAWVMFMTDSVKDKTWNEEAYEHLVLKPEDKSTLRTFVDSQLKSPKDFDDVLRGKGKGVIVLLSGPHGVGKTLTAESIAEVIKRPLYSLSESELGNDTGGLEDGLGEVLDVCERWTAVLLLEECDMFLADRSRNRLVPATLRLMEYHRGVLFLTTNHHEQLDSAFTSQVDLSLQYPALDQAARLKIWTNLLKKNALSDEEGKVTSMTEDELEDLSRIEVNGRDIRGIVKTSRLLAAKDASSVQMKHVDQVLRMRVPANRMAGHQMYY